MISSKISTNAKATTILWTLIALIPCSSFVPDPQVFHRRSALSPLSFQNEGDHRLLWELAPKNPPQSPPPPPPPPEPSIAATQHDANNLVGKVLKNSYLLESQIPIGSDKCRLYQAFHVLDREKANPVIIKLSKNTSSIWVEFEVYISIRNQLREDEKRCFVDIYDHIDERECGVPGHSALVLEKGEADLRTHLQQYGRFQGAALRTAMKQVIQIVETLHSRGMIWTEIKAENFIIQRDGTIKGIDLESVIYHQNYLQMYTAESVPPEFPIDDIYQCVPKIQPDYSFDVWGLGILLFEMATGKPFYDGGLQDIEFIKVRWVCILFLLLFL